MNKINLLTEQDILGICGGVISRFGDIVSGETLGLINNGTPPGQLGFEAGGEAYGEQIAMLAQDLLGSS